MAVKVFLTTALFAAMAPFSLASLSCPSGYSAMLCQGSIAPWSRDSSTWGGLCNFYPSDESLPVAGRCTYASSPSACCRGLDNSRCSIGYDCVFPVDSTTATASSTSLSSTVTSVTSSSASATPSSPPLANGWVTAYPCAFDPPSRVFANAYRNGRILNNSPQACTTDCASLGFVLAGVEYGKECFCGNTYADSAGPLAAPVSQCNMPCDIGGGFCGAGDRIQIYKYTSVIKPVLPPRWKQISACAVDSSARLFFGTEQISLGSLTPEYCARYCATYYYSVAGVEYGRECWCGGGIKIGELVERPASECAMPCPEPNPGLTCGGPDRIQVYGEA